MVKDGGAILEIGKRRMKMFSFVRRPDIRREVTDVPSGFSLFFTHGHFDKKREEIRESLKAFEGDVFTSATYNDKLEMEVHFPNAERKAEWLEHARGNRLVS